MVNLTFLCVYKKITIKNCDWFMVKDGYYVFKKQGKIFFVDKSNSLLLKFWRTK